MIQESYPPNLENDAFGLLCQRARCVPLRVIIAEIRLACHPAAEAAAIEQEAKMRSMEAALMPDLRGQRGGSLTPLRGLTISVTSWERWYAEDGGTVVANQPACEAVTVGNKMVSHGPMRP